MCNWKKLCDRSKMAIVIFLNLLVACDSSICFQVPCCFILHVILFSSLSPSRSPVYCKARVALRVWPCTWKPTQSSAPSTRSKRSSAAACWRTAMGLAQRFATWLWCLSSLRLRTWSCCKYRMCCCWYVVVLLLRCCFAFGLCLCSTDYMLIGIKLCLIASITACCFNDNKHNQ